MPFSKRHKAASDARHDTFGQNDMTIFAFPDKEIVFSLILSHCVGKFLKFFEMKKEKPLQLKAARASLEMKFSLKHRRNTVHDCK